MMASSSDGLVSSQDKEDLIVTADLHPSVQTQLNTLRQTYFPAAINFLDAHLTLFNAVAGSQKQRLYSLLEQERHHLPLAAKLTGLIKLGRGFAVGVQAPVLAQLHQRWQTTLASTLRPQDRQKRVFHVTLQNKVTPAQARADMAQAQQRFEPRSTTITGFSVWRYEGGPWTLLRSLCAASDL